MNSEFGIPKGCYCYDGDGTCPYWSLNPRHKKQANGYCSYLECGDWNSGGIGLLWDKVKECNINVCTDEELLERGVLGDSEEINKLMEEM